MCVESLRFHIKGAIYQWVFVVVVSLYQEEIQTNFNCGRDKNHYVFQSGNVLEETISTVRWAVSSRHVAAPRTAVIMVYSAGHTENARQALSESLSECSPWVLCIEGEHGGDQWVLSIIWFCKSVCFTDFEKYGVLNIWIGVKW